MPAGRAGTRRWSGSGRSRRSGSGWAGATAGLDIGGLAAGAVRHGDFPDRVAGAFGVQQGPGVTPDAIAVPVEAERGDLVHGVAAAVFADPVVAAGHRIASVVQELGQDVDGDTGVGMPLGIAVPVGVRHDLGRVEHPSVAGAQGRQGADPVAVPGLQGRSADRLGPVGVPVGGGQQLQFRGLAMGEPLPDPVLLAGDHLGGGVADGQPAAQPVGFDIVIDQHRAAVFVTGQAVQRQVEDVLGPAASVDPDLGGDFDLSRFKGVQVSAQHRHDLRRQVTARFAAFGVGGDVGAFDGDVTGQPGRDLTGPGQAQGTDPGQHRPHIPADHVPAVAADLTGCLQVGDPVEEALQVSASQRGRVGPAIWPAVQMLRQQPHIAELRPDPGRAAAAVAGQLLGRPPLGGGSQPRLRDLGERQGARVAENRQVPDVLALLAARVGQRPADIAGEGAQHRPGTLTRGQTGIASADRDGLLAAEGVADRPEHHIGKPEPAPQAGLQAGQHLYHDQYRQRPQIHLPRFGHPRLGGLPPPLIHPRVAPLSHAPPLVVGIAVADGAVGRADARRHQARRKGRQGPYPPVGEEQLQGNRRPPVAELRGVRFAHHCLPHRRLAPASRHCTVLGGRGRCGQPPGGGDAGDAHPQPLQPGEAPVAHAGTVVMDGPGASFCPAHLAAQQPVLRGQEQDPRRRIPPGLFQQSAVEHPGQAGGCAVQDDPVQHMRELAGCPGGRGRLGKCCGGHWLPPSCSRGLGTASTAARSREELGCTYT